MIIFFLFFQVVYALNVVDHLFVWICARPTSQVTFIFAMLSVYNIFLPMCYTWLYLVTLSWTFEVITCIGVPAFKYRFPTVIDVLPIELYRF